MTRRQLQWIVRFTFCIALLSGVVARAQYSSANFALRNAVMMNQTNKALELLQEFDGDFKELDAMGEPLLNRAIMNGNATLVDALIKKGSDPNSALRNWGDPPLFAAIQYRRWQIGQQLIKAGASCVATNQSKMTPLGVLLEQWWGNDSDATNRLMLVRELLAHGANPFAPDRPGSARSILESVIERRSVDDLAELLLTNNPASGLRSADGDSALHLAASYNLTNVVAELVRLGVPVNETNADGLTALRMLAGFGGFDGQTMSGRGPFVFTSGILRTPPIRTKTSNVVDVLLSVGAKLDVFCAAGLSRTNELAAFLSTNSALVNARDGIGRTPICYAVFATNTNAFYTLVKAHADPNIATTRPARRVTLRQTYAAASTPLHFAALHRSTEMMRALIKAGANVNSADANGDTPSHLGARLNPEALEVLIDAHANVNVTNRDGKTPLRVAVETSIARTVETLFSAGAKTNADPDGSTLLHVAAEHYVTDGSTIRTLLSHGFGIEARDSKGRTPFLRATQAHQLGAMVILANEGANVNAKDNDGNTALHYTAAEQNDMGYYTPEASFWERQKNRAFMTPGFGQSLVHRLVRWKVLSPPKFGGTNESPTVWLLNHNASITTNALGQTPLHELFRQPWVHWDTMYSSNRLHKFVQCGARLDVPDSQGLTCLHIAYTNSSAILFSNLINQTTNLNSWRDQNGRGLLHWAALSWNRYYQIAQQEEAKFALLLEHCPDVNAKDNAGNTPLHVLFESWSENQQFDNGLFRDRFKLLLQKGADLNATNNAGETPLVVIARKPLSLNLSSADIDEVFIKPKWDYTARDRSGEPVVHLLFRNLHSGYYWSLQLLKELAKRRELINLVDQDGDTLLHRALRANEYQTTHALIENGADPAIRNKRGESGYWLATVSRYGGFENSIKPPKARYGFFQSIYIGDKNSFEEWLKAEPRLVAVTNFSGQSVLTVAIGHRQLHMAERLIEAGAQEDLFAAIALKHDAVFDKLLSQEKTINDRWLFDAVEYKNPRALQKLVEAGGNVHAVNNDGYSLLLRATNLKQSELAQWLKERGCAETVFDAVYHDDPDRVAEFLKADPTLLNKTNAAGRTLLMRASYLGAGKVVSLLLREKADIQSWSATYHWTALHMAIARKHLDVAEMLLKAGAQPNAFDSAAIAPLHLAAAYGDTNAVSLLVRYKADVNLRAAKDNRGASLAPLHWAVYYGHTNVISQLLALGANPKIKGWLYQQEYTPRSLVTGHMTLAFSMPPEAMPQRAGLRMDGTTAPVVEMLKKAETGR